MGSTSDLPVMEKAAKFLEEMQIPFEMNALSAHRTPAEVEDFARGAKERGLRVIIAGAGMAAALPGVIAASTTLPVIGVPIKGMLDGLDAMLSIIQMPPGIPVATVGVNGAQNAAILAAEMLALSDEVVAQRLARGGRRDHHHVLPAQGRVDRLPLVRVQLRDALFAQGSHRARVQAVRKGQIPRRARGQLLPAGHVRHEPRIVLQHADILR